MRSAEILSVHHTAEIVLPCLPRATVAAVKDLLAAGRLRELTRASSEPYDMSVVRTNGRGRSYPHAES